MHYVGTAAWTLPKTARAAFPDAGTHLQRYAQRLSAVEINSSFYRDHKAATYRKWAASVPADFRFAVKLSKRITHEHKLVCAPALLSETLTPLMSLEEKLGIVLVQLPAKVAFDLAIAQNFLRTLRAIYAGPIALEARHASWGSDAARHLCDDFAAGPVISDPSRIAVATDRPELPVYYRLHGSPVMYRSNYEPDALRTWAAQATAHPHATSVWVMFDNTTFGHATQNALDFEQLLHPHSSRGSGVAA